jgi:DNA-binding NtrC family response regulator
VKSKKIDLAIVDLILPGKDGVDVISEMKEVAPDLIILAMSAGPEYLGGDRKNKFRDNYLTMAEVNGAKKTFSKPFDLEKFLTEVREVLKLGQ